MSCAAALHVHSDYSHDAVDSLEALRDRCVERGISTVCLTEHAEDLDAATFAEYVRHCEALSDATFSYVPGLEYRFPTHRGVHVLALGAGDWMTPTTLEAFFAEADRVRAFTILAHPLTCRYSPPSIVGERIDGIEVWNARYNTRYLPDPDAITLYRRLAAARPTLRATVGLDLHDARVDGELRIAMAGAGDDFIGALRRGEYTNAGRNLAFDASANIPDRTMQTLRIQRHFIDAAARVHRRVSFAARRLGLT